MASRALGLAVLVALLAASLSVSVGVAGGSRAEPLPRATADRPDDAGPQIHVMYVIPSDGVDAQLDTNGVIANWIDSMQSWLREQTGGRTFRLDTYQGQPDITFFRLRASQAEAEARDFAAQEIETELSAAGYGSAGYINAGRPVPLNVRDKIYAVFYGGQSKTNCGNGGSMAFVYLPDCHGIESLAMIHEILHSLGFVPSCALHFLAPDHVNDPADLMYPFIRSTAMLDPGHDDYFDAHIPGCHDLASSRFWTDGGVSLTLSTTPTSGGEGTVDAAASGTNYENSFPNGYALKCPPSCTGYADTWPTQTVTVEAVPAVGSDFLHWTGACTGRLLECQLTLDHSTSVGAVFKRTAPLGPRRVNVSVTGSGHVTSTPIGLSCPKTCTAAFRPGVTLILRARPATGWRFRSWRGACHRRRPSCSLFIYAQGGNRAVQARFEKNAP
jgi:hypothetical protein